MHSPPRLKPFDEDEFLTQLAEKGTLCKTPKSKKEVELYRYHFAAVAAVAVAVLLF